MTGSATKNYVLVHGAWAGGWVWQSVANSLRAQGHTVTTPTLTGLGERQHLLSEAVGLDTHVQDIVANIEMEGLQDVILVGWSYGGMVASGVLARVPDRIKSMVYLDAFIGENGKAVADAFGPDEPNPIKDFIQNKQNIPPIIPLEVFGVTEQSVIDYVKPRLGEQPYKAFLQKSGALKNRPENIPHTYIRCTRFENPTLDEFLQQAQRDAGFNTFILDMSHFPMLTDPEATTELLLSID